MLDKFKTGFGRRTVEHEICAVTNPVLEMNDEKLKVLMIAL